MLIDEVRISVKAGDGGSGNAHFYSDAHRPRGGPDGGNGGDGGSVYFVADSDISLLSQFRHQKKFFALNGAKGGSNKKTGKNQLDLVLKVPLGTVVNYDNGTSLEFTSLGQKLMIAKGGRGGRGNYTYRSSINTTPQEFQPGQTTAVKKLYLQLKLIANAGLIGLPNAGKSSLLNELTSSNVRTGAYAFTTLEPNLGVTKSKHILADIPGLIEGASAGKGLGDKFLRHIERTSLLIHCLSAESIDPASDYKIIRQELKNYSSALLKKPQLLLITKSDLYDSQKKLKAKFAFLKPDLYVSIIDDTSLQKLNRLLSQKL